VKVKVKVKSRKCGIEVGEMTSRSGWENGEGEKSMYQIPTLE
jgi:hypothetical protein